jgi:hypothetical protein
MHRDAKVGGAVFLRDIGPEICFGEIKGAVVVGQLNLVRICYPGHRCRVATHIAQSQQDDGFATG